MSAKRMPHYVAMYVKTPLGHISVNVILDINWLLTRKHVKVSDSKITFR